MRLRLGLAALILAAPPSPATAQTATVTGFVLTADSFPAESASINFNMGSVQRRVVADSLGFFRLDSLPLGKAHVRIFGWREPTMYSTAFDVHAGVTKAPELMLPPIPVDPFPIKIDTVPLDSIVRVGLSERLLREGPPGPPVQVLSIASTRVYSCLLPLLTSYSQVGDSIAVEAHGVPSPAVCPSALGPAGWEVGLRLAVGRYPFSVKVGSKIDSYSLLVTGTVLRLEPVGRLRVSQPASQAWRVPPWSVNLRCTTTRKDGGRCQDFRGQVAVIGDLRQFAFPSGVKTPYGPPTGYDQFRWEGLYLYSNPATIRVLRRLIRRLARNPDDRGYCFSLALLTWQAEAEYANKGCETGPGTIDR